MKRSQGTNDYYDGYGSYGDGNSQQQYAEFGYVPSYQQQGYDAYGTQAQYPGQAQQGGMQAATAQDRRGRVTSVFALLMAMAVVALSVGGLLMPRFVSMSRGVTSVTMANIPDILTAVVSGYGSIFVALLLEIPTVLLALRSASKPQGHVGRGRGIVSVIISVVFPVLCLMQLSFIVIKQVQSVNVQDIIPQVVTDANGKTRIVAPEGLGEELGSVIDQVNDMADEGYSFGVDGDGNVTATNPDGKTVTVTPEQLSEIGM